MGSQKEKQKNPQKTFIFVSNLSPFKLQLKNLFHGAWRGRFVHLLAHVFNGSWIFFPRRSLQKQISRKCFQLSELGTLAVPHQVCKRWQ